MGPVHAQERAADPTEIERLIRDLHVLLDLSSPPKTEEDFVHRATLHDLSTASDPCLRGGLWWESLRNQRLYMALHRALEARPILDDLERAHGLRYLPRKLDRVDPTTIQVTWGLSGDQHRFVRLLTLRAHEDGLVERLADGADPRTNPRWEWFYQDPRPQ